MYSYIPRSHPCYCRVTSPPRQSLFLFLVIESRPRRLSINASLSLLSGFQLWRYVSCSVCRRFLLDPLTSTLDPEALFLPESSVLPLLSCRLFSHQPVSWTGSCFLFHVYPVCCSNYSRVAVDTGVAGSRQETIVAALCFTLPTLLHIHHVTVRFGCLPLYVALSLYLGALSNFGFLCPQPDEISDPRAFRFLSFRGRCMIRVKFKDDWMIGCPGSKKTECMIIKIERGVSRIDDDALYSLGSFCRHLCVSACLAWACSDEQTSSRL